MKQLKNLQIRKPCEKFPDYNEVLNVIKLVVERHDLGFHETGISKEAKLVFKDIGRKLKDRKWRDEKELLACYLTDVIKLDQDLAENDEYLKKTLEKSSKKVT